MWYVTSRLFFYINFFNFTGFCFFKFYDLVFFCGLNEKKVCCFIFVRTFFWLRLLTGLFRLSVSTKKSILKQMVLHVFRGRNPLYVYIYIYYYWSLLLLFLFVRNSSRILSWCRQIAAKTRFDAAQNSANTTQHNSSCSSVASRQNKRGQTASSYFLLCLDLSL